VAVNASISSVIATSTIAAISPVISTPGNINISAILATSTAQALNPTLSIPSSVNVSGVLAQSTTTANAPTVTAGTSVSPVSTGLIASFDGTQVSQTSADHKTWYDQSGSGNNITITPNGASTIPATLWNATNGFTPDGNISGFNDSTITYGMTLPFDPLNGYPITWEFVIKPVSNATTELIKVLTNNGNSYTRMLIDNTNTIQAYKGGVGTSGTTPTYTIPAGSVGKYIHLVYVFTPTNLTIYLNGSQVAQSNVVYFAFTDGDANGRVVYDYQKNVSALKILRAYNGALSASDVTNNYNAYTSLLG
jgi:hypothetical protein